MTTTERNTDNIDVLTVDLNGLAKMLGCGTVTARKVGEEAKARIKVGKRVLFDVTKIRSYIAEASGN